MVRVDSSRVEDEWLSMKEAELEPEAAEAASPTEGQAEGEETIAANENGQGKEGEGEESPLDKTIISADPLSEEERLVLTKFRQHETEVAKVLSIAEELRSKGLQSAVDVRSFAGAAQQLEESTEVDTEILQREAVSSQLEWPAKELKHARVLVSALDAWEQALAKGKEQLTAASSGCIDACGALLDSFQRLKDAQARAQASGCPAVKHADVGLTGKEAALRPLLEALLDKAQELEDLQSFKAQLDEVRTQTLKDLRVQLPDSDEGTAHPPLATQESPVPLEDAGKTEEGVKQEAEHLDPHQLWHAVHMGDESIVKAFVKRKACDGTTRDASGHSIFWHSISFNHLGLAQYIWDSFPPGSSGGIEVDEVHQRKGDTLLHLLCLNRPFNAEAAALFKHVAAKAPPPVFQKQNAIGLTFLDIAIDTLNFWVLTFVLKNFQVPGKALLCTGRAPLRRLLQALCPPTAPQAYAAPSGFPTHFRVASMLQQDPSGSVPYADVAFDVGPERQGVAMGRFLAHRVVVVAQSPVLFEMLEKMPLTELPKEKVTAALIRVDERISQEVWRSVLQFMYQGTIFAEHCSYLKDAGKCVELLHACLLYKLPEPLLRLALMHLFPLLPSSSASCALQVFALCTSDEHINNKDLSSVREGAAWVLLHNAHSVFTDIEATNLCEILNKAVRCLESKVFENPEKPAVIEDQLSYSFHGVPQDILSQTLSMTRLVPTHFQTKEDLLSQSLVGVSAPWQNQRGDVPGRLVMY